MDPILHVNSVFKMTKWFKKKMRNRLLLPANMGKNHWRFCSKQYLVNALLRKVDQYSEGSGPEERIEKLADIGNYAMMLADKERETLKNDQRSKRVH